MKKAIALLVTCILVATVTGANRPPGQAPAKERDGLPLAYHEDFEAGDDDALRAKFEFTDPAAWEIRKDGDRRVLALVKQSDYKPAVRSPVNIAWVKDLKVGPAFVMEVRLRSTTRDYGHRDLCLFFGGQDPTHFFYVHVAKAADPNAHNVFLVNGEPRKNIATRTTKGADWDDDYHTVRVTRKASGEIEVFWDGQSIMATDNKHFPVGRVGVGSFDDTGHFDQITVWGQVEKK